MRIILHMDMDAFYAAIEQRDHPELRGKPVIVGGPLRRGVVSTASYEARPFGVHSALPMAQALRLCPKAVVVPVDMDHYCEVSDQIMAVLDRFSPRVEPLSLDEAFLDMTGCEKLFGDPMAMAQAIKDEIRKTTQLSCSVGIAKNKFLAKLGSDLNKPDGITLIPFGQEKEFISPLPVRKLWGVGPKTEAVLLSLGLKTLGQIAACDPSFLRKELGSLGDHVYQLASGKDERQVLPHRDRQSIGAECTLQEDVQGLAEVERILSRQCQKVAYELRQKSMKACSVRVKVRYAKSFQLATRDAALSFPCDDSKGLMQTARKLLLRLDLEKPIRLVGVAAFQLMEAKQPIQGDLFLETNQKKHSRMEHTLDAIREKFGDKIKRGCVEEEE